MIELTFLNELMLIIQANQKSAIFVTKFQVTSNKMSAMGHDLLMMSMSLTDISGADYHCIINGINKSETIKLMHNTDMTEKSGTLLK